MKNRNRAVFAAAGNAKHSLYRSRKNVVTVLFLNRRGIGLPVAAAAAGLTIA